MGNQPSSEAYGESLFVPPPSHADRPLPPIPPLSTHASRLSHYSHYSHASASTSLSASASASAAASSSASAQKLSKPRIRSTAGLLKSPDVDVKGTGSGSRRFSTSGIAQLVTSSFSSSPNTPTSSSFATHRRRSSSKSRSLPLPPPPLLPGSLSGTSGAQSPSVFTFEEAVVAVTGQRDPVAWQPPVSTIYPSPSLDLELLQEQQARQLEFELRQRQNQLQFQQLQREAQKLRRDRERELRRYTSYEFGLYDQAVIDTELDGDDEADIEAERLENELLERGRQQLRQLKKQQKQKERSRRRSSFFRSRSSQRPSLDRNQLDDRDYHNFHNYQRRNSIGSVYRGTGDGNTWDIGPMTYDQVLGQYYGGPLSENWPPQAGSRTSWNYDMSSYAAKRLLHLVDDNPLDNRLEQASVASESRFSMVSEVTWKSSHPVRPESPTLTRANSDLSLYAPVRRTSIVQVPGVATRRNSTSSFTSAGGASMRPAFRHSHPATTPSLSRRTSFESTGSRVMSMPPPELQRTELGADNTVGTTARVSTPPDGEYNTIGTFKLGSLRITNGAESPMSSPETRRARKEKAAREESARSPTVDADERTRALAALSANIDTETANTNSVPAAVELIDGSRQISPLSPALFQPPVELFAGIVAKPEVFHELPAREPVGSPTDLPQLELSQDLFADFEFSSFSFEDTIQVPAVEPLALQPRSRPQPQPQQQILPAPAALQTTSKATAVEDLLFEEDDHSTSGYADPEILDVRLDPNAKASPKRGKAGILAARKSAHSIQSVSRSDSGFVSSPTSESSHKPLSKADSGYSSNVSLRSFKQAASKLMSSGAKAANRLSSEKDTSAPASERQSFVIDELQLPSPTINTPDMAFRSISPATMMQIKRKPLPPNAARPPPPRRDAPLPPPPPISQTSSPENMSRDALPLSPVSVSMTDTSTPATSESSMGPAKKRHAVPSPLDNVRATAPRSDSQPSPVTSPVPLTPASVRSNGSVSAHSIGSGTQRPSKLLRFLSFANVSPNVAPANKGPPAVHVTHIENDETADIPAVPSNVNDKLREHTGPFPMTTKRLALKTQMSRDTLKTIFSVGSLETRSSSDLHSKAKDDVSRESSRGLPRRNTFQAPSSLVSAAAAAAVMPLKAVSKRKSRLSMAVDFTDEFEEDDLAQAENAPEYISTNTSTPEPSEDTRAKRARRSWLRWGKDGERQTPTPEHSSDDDAAVDQGMGNTLYDEAPSSTNHLHRTPSRSSSIISRTMSLTAQLERSLSMKITFPRISMSRPSTSDRPKMPISAFSTAFNSSQPMPISPSLPSPLFAEAMEQQRRAMTPESLAAASPPVSARMQQIRPSMLRVPPPLRSQSTPPSEAGSRRASRQSSQDSLYNMANAQYYQSTTNLASNSTVDHNDASHIAGVHVASPPPMDAEAQSSHTTLQRRGSLDYPHGPRRSLSGNDTQAAFMAAGGKMHMPHGGGGSQDGGQPRVIRHRASFNGYSSGPSQSWDGGKYAMPSQQTQPRHNPPRMSNGYTGQIMDPFGGGHRRSGSASSGHSDIYQLQQQQAWDYYYQQYARPPPNVARGSHHRNRSMGSRHGPVPGPQAPYRILHSYNSPAYRGVPIWG